jgi:hypothetical protein
MWADLVGCGLSGGADSDHIKGGRHLAFAVAERHISPLSLLSPHFGVPAARCGFP